MSTKEKKLLLPIVTLIVAATALTLISVRTGTAGFDRARPPLPTATPLASAAPQGNTEPNGGFRPQLARQPATFKLARRLGKRFRGTGLGASVLIGTLRRGAGEQAVRIMRKQVTEGERVEVALGNGPASLTWDAREGALSSGSPASAEERLLLERLVLDTPDQFILAQLRGASYQTIARGVRPENAGDDYSGPIWDIVEVKDSIAGSSTSERTGQRLYWINSSAGIIDKIVSTGEGVDVIATLSGWVNQRGELVPSRITWTQNGGTLMQLDFTSFNYSEQQSQQQSQ